MSVDGSITQAHDTRVLGEVHRLALREAVEYVDRPAAEDMAQGIVCGCLLKMRDGTWREPRSLEAWVPWVVKRRFQDGKRRTKAGLKRHAIHGKVLEEHNRAWMCPEQRADIKELEDVVWSIVLELPETCCQVWYMLRVEHQTYEQAAEELGVTRSAVSASLVRAQHLIRKELLARGVDLPPEFASAGRVGAGEDLV